MNTANTNKSTPLPSSLAYRVPRSETASPLSETEAPSQPEPEEDPFAANKRKLQELMAATIQKHLPKGPIDRSGDEWQPETYYSDVLGCEFTFPLSKFLAKYNKERGIKTPNRGYNCYDPYEREEKEPEVKRMKFDPPTFQFGEKDGKKQEEEAAETQEQDSEKKPANIKECMVPTASPFVFQNPWPVSSSSSQGPPLRSVSKDLLHSSDGKPHHCIKSENKKPAVKNSIVPTASAFAPTSSKNPPLRSVSSSPQDSASRESHPSLNDKPQENAMASSVLSNDRFVASKRVSDTSSGLPWE